MAINYGNNSPLQNNSAKQTVLSLIVIIRQQRRLIFHYPPLNLIMEKKGDKKNEGKNKTIQKINEVKVLTYKTLVGCLTLLRLSCLWQTLTGMKSLVGSMSMVTSFNKMVTR
jgi:hypothetical protein